MKIIEVDEIGYEHVKVMFSEAFIRAEYKGKAIVNVSGIESIRGGDVTAIRMASGDVIFCSDSIESIKARMSGQWAYSYIDLSKC